MSWAGMPVGLRTQVIYDGETYEITDWITTAATTEVILTGAVSVCRMTLVSLLYSGRATILPDGPGPEPDDEDDPAAITLLGLSAHEFQQVRERVDHIREVQSGYRSGDTRSALPDEPREQYKKEVPLMRRYAAKAVELGVTERTVRRWAKRYNQLGAAGLAPEWPGVASRVDPRWVEAAERIMAEHTYESKPSEAAVIFQTAKRLERELGLGVVQEPSRATAYRKLKELERQHRIFGGTTKRNRDIAERPKRPYGKLRPTRPGEYVILDTTPLDVFALDPRTLEWVRLELTVAMDWYTRCVVAFRLTPYSTKAVDAAAVMFQVMRPAPACPSWPDYAVWPEHGMPREVLIDPDQIDRSGKEAASPAINPETIVVDHGKIYVGEHLTSVCQRLGISIQPARVRVGRDKGPLERFFRTVREGLLQYLPGYKGPDINARGLDVEEHAFFYIDQLEAIVREWIACVYHHRGHDSLFDPLLPKLGSKSKRKPKPDITPAQMFAHGIARAGYIEVPRDPELAYEFLKVEARTIQHYGIRRDNLIYRPHRDDTILVELASMPSPYRGYKRDRWPIHIDPDDVTRIYIRHPETRRWHTLEWEHASEFPMAFSDEGLRYFRKIVRAKHGFVDQRMALDEMMTRWNIGMGVSAVERRILLRMIRDDAKLSHQTSTDDAEIVRSLPSVDKALSPPTGNVRSDIRRMSSPELGDDDSDDDLDDDYEIDELEWR